MPATEPKLCECGCGQPAPIAKCNSKRDGYVKGQPTRFIHGHSRNGPRKQWADPEHRKNMRHYGIVLALNGVGIFAPGVASKGGKVGGVKAAQTNMANRTSIFAPGMNSVAGRTSFEKKAGCHAPELQGYGGHVRWHVNRGIENPKCAFCCDPALGPQKKEKAEEETPAPLQEVGATD